MLKQRLPYSLYVISLPDREAGAIHEEAQQINALFDAGMMHFHLRKKTWFKKEIIELLNEIDSRHHRKIILHSQPDLVDEFDLAGFHFNKDFPYQEKWAKTLKSSAKTISVSSHSICDMGEYELEVDYQFVSPVFPSISKENHSDIIERKKLSDYLLLKPKSRFIALSGIEPDNVSEILELGFDGVASIGFIWQKDSSNTTVDNFTSLMNSVKASNSLKI